MLTDPLPPEPVLTDLLTGELHVVTAGVPLFAEALAEQAVEVTEVAWRPPAANDRSDLPALLARVAADPRRREANRTAADRMLASRARLVDVRPAGEALGLTPGTFLHAGPPLATAAGTAWQRASGPLRGALQGAMVFEGMAGDPQQAEQLLAGAGPPGSGAAVVLDPCHHHGAVGPMAGVISPSMWLFELEDAATGRRAWCSLNEGLGKVLRYGAFGPEVIDRLRWMSAVLGPMLQRAVRTVRDTVGPVDITAIIAQMLQMGDEGHNRNRAGTLMLLRELLPALIDSGFDPPEVARAVGFVAGNDHFFLNLAMPACKLAADAARGLPGSTVVVAMARNGTDFGLQVSGTGDRWFTGPANTPEGLYLAGFGPEDANPDIGDSAITETAGIGGFAMAAAPAIVRLVGGDVPFALATTARMHQICVAENPGFAIPVLEFRGTATGIDVTRVLRTGILPQINTGMAGRVAGTGQVGAGLVTPPAEVFTAALAALADLAPEPTLLH